MRLTFLGTGTSMGVPVAGGFGFENRALDFRDNRYRTSAWVQTKETSIVIDTGPEFRLQTLRSGIGAIDLLLLTHEHTDHIAGLDDLRPYCFTRGKAIPTYTTEGCVKTIRRKFDYMFGPNKTPGSVDLDLQVMKDTIQFRDCTITPLMVDHINMPVMGFRINDLSYITDAKIISDETLEKVKGSKVLVLNGLRWSPDHPTHLSIPDAVEIATKLEIPITYLVHISSYVVHKEVSERLPDHVKLAYDQLSIEI